MTTCVMMLESFSSACIFFSEDVDELAPNFGLELTSNLVDVQRTLLKVKRENWHVGFRLFFAQKDKESLDALKLRVQESRNMFEVSFLSNLLALS